MKENLKKTEPTPELLDIGLIGLSVMGRSLALNMATWWRAITAVLKSRRRSWKNIRIIT